MLVVDRSHPGAPVRRLYVKQGSEFCPGGRLSRTVLVSPPEPELPAQCLPVCRHSGLLGQADGNRAPGGCWWDPGHSDCCFPIASLKSGDSSNRGPLPEGPPEGQLTLGEGYWACDAVV